ncbi:MAG: class I tRNA ligase family protein [Bacteroidota bacterium]
MEYDFDSIEKDARAKWQKDNVYEVPEKSSKPKFYILDMFPYPSGAGLHVGHPLGYIASDIFARYKRLKGYNVLHPMGFDAFGLPAEQYALETGQHPAITTKTNIARYREQLDKIGFCYDWKREVRTSDPKYYKWTQWIFLQLFDSWMDRSQQKARRIAELVSIFEQEGNVNHVCPGDEMISFDASAWKGYSVQEQRRVLMQYRLAFLDYAVVWWCEALGTVLANDEVVNGVSERGGHPVEKKQMRQWFLRITEYAERLLKSLETLEWSDAMKEMQRNWIGKSYGAEVDFYLDEAAVNGTKRFIKIFTTRADTIFGADFMVLAPEHELVSSITTAEQRTVVEDYVTYVKSRSERERMTEVKQVSGAFTGAYVLHPFTGKQMPVWISEYVLSGYGTGAIMAVPCGDDRDHAFAKHFHIPISNIFGELYDGEKAYTEKAGRIQKSSFISMMEIPQAAEKVIDMLEDLQIGKRKVNYKLRDAGFSRQRYWGEPFPIKYEGETPYAIDAKELPVILPHVESYKPGPEGQGPLANIPEWMAEHRETNTMPGYAGSSWYFLRYMDPHNEHEFASRAATDYWKQVDIYIGGTEHAVGHLLYSRMWTKALYDLGYIGFDEPFKKLVNQGMIQGVSKILWTVGLKGAEVNHVPAIYISYDLCKEFGKSLFGADILKMIQQRNPTLIVGPMEGSKEIEIILNPYRVDINIVDKNDLLDINEFSKQLDINKVPVFLSNDNTIRCSSEVEKMSKSKRNVINPDDIVAQYGADTFRMYEMFLGPIDVSKPWDTKGIEGVHRFIKKMWRLYNDEQKGWIVSDEAATDAELRILHKTIKKTEEDIERFAFNTAVSSFMICVNELSSLNCHKLAVLEPLAVCIAAFAPHTAEELWHSLGHKDSVLNAAFPTWEQQYVTDNSKVYPVAVNGKTRAEMEFPLDMEQADIEKVILADATIQKYMEGKAPKKVIFVKGKMINVVV